MVKNKDLDTYLANQNFHLLTEEETQVVTGGLVLGAFRLALEVLISRRDPNAAYQPYPFDLADPEGEVEAILMQKIKQAE